MKKNKKPRQNWLKSIKKENIDKFPRKSIEGYGNWFFVWLL